MFSVSEYFDRIEKACLEIQENRKPVDHTIVLWWGLDGLQINDNGKLEWVSRRKKETTENVFYQPCQSISPAQAGFPWFNQMRSTMAPMWALQRCCIQYQAQYPPYYYGGYCGNYLG